MDRALERGGSSRDALARRGKGVGLCGFFGRTPAALGASLVKLDDVRGRTISSHSSGLKVDTFLSHFACCPRR